MTLKNNRAPLLSIIKLYASFHHHTCIQTGVTVRKRLSWVVTSVTLTFDLWPWPFAWTSLLSLVITPENFMMVRWWEYSQKGVTDRQTDGRTDRRTDWTIHRAAWSQLKIGWSWNQIRTRTTCMIPFLCLQYRVIRLKSLSSHSHLFVDGTEIIPTYLTVCPEQSREIHCDHGNFLYIGDVKFGYNNESVTPQFCSSLPWWFECVKILYDFQRFTTEQSITDIRVPPGNITCLGDQQLPLNFIEIEFSCVPGGYMMTSSNGSIFRVTDHLCGKFTGPRWILHTKASDA